MLNQRENFEKNLVVMFTSFSFDFFFSIYRMTCIVANTNKNLPNLDYAHKVVTKTKYKESVKKSILNIIKRHKINIFPTFIRVVFLLRTKK